MATRRLRVPVCRKGVPGERSMANLFTIEAMMCSVDGC
jgi:hypothetical protein